MSKNTFPPNGGSTLSSPCLKAGASRGLLVNIAAIKSEVRLETVIHHSVPLTRQGRVYVGRCPFHQDGGRPNLVVFPETQTWACFVCGIQGDVLDWMARASGSTITEALHHLTASVGGSVAPIAAGPSFTPGPAPSAVAPAIRDAAYRAWMATQSINAAHQAALVARGLDAHTITAAGFRSLQPGPVPPSLSALARVPGFYADRGRWVASGPAGLWIPVRNVQGHILGAQIRADHSQGGKYRWFSSAHRPDGASSGAPVHVAAPAHHTTVWITEGPLKAIVSATHLHQPVLGLPGVAAWRAALPILQTLHPRRVCIAFDQDADPATRTAVDALAQQLGAALTQAGYPWHRIAWHGPAKGLDDALGTHAAFYFAQEETP